MTTATRTTDKQPVDGRDAKATDKTASDDATTTTGADNKEDAREARIAAAKARSAAARARRDAGDSSAEGKTDTAADTGDDPRAARIAAAKARSAALRAKSADKSDKPAGKGSDGEAPARTRTRPARKPKPQGQWKIDGNDPLNDDERIKQEDAGLNIKDRIRNIYAVKGFESIPAEDLSPRFKWVGLYTQRKQGMSGEQTSTLTNAELQDHYFMLRVRLDGGMVNADQLRVIGEISRDFARGTADFTDRQNIQLHWIRIEDIPEIWDRLEGVGLSTDFGCGDVPRVVLGSPVAGIAADEIIDGSPAIEEITEKWLRRDEFANLPRKFKSAVSGNSRQDITHEIQDLSFIGLDHPEHGPGFDVWVGGGLSTNPMIAQRLGVWVPLEDVPEVWANVVRIFRDYGYRRLRNRARLKFLVADWGVEKFRKVLEEDYLGRPLLDGPAPETAPGYRDHIGVHDQRDGLKYVGVKPTVGHTDGDQLIRLSEIADRFGSGRVRTTPDKELLFLDVKKGRVPHLIHALEAEGLSPKPTSFRRDIISCTGLEFCKLALVVTKKRALDLADELEERLGDLDVPLKISLNGCPNSCARTQIADIGLKGQIVTDDDGNRVEGFQVHLGGAIGLHPDFGRKLRGHKVTSAELTDYIVRVVENYKSDRNRGEQFRDWVLRAPEEVLQ